MTEEEMRREITTEFQYEQGHDLSKTENKRCDCNLFKEIEAVLGDKIDDLKSVYIGNTKLDRSAFLEMAKNFWYENGYGLQVIHPELYMYTSQGTFCREEYDGAEGWRFVPFRTE